MRASSILARRRSATPLLVALLGISCGDGADADSAGRTRVPKLRGPELVPQELVAALLAGWVGPGPTLPEIVVGRLPEKMPFEVPRPDDAQVLGALARSSNGTLVFSVAQRPIEAMKAYVALLRRAGWDDQRGDVGSGFQPPVTPSSGTFCQGEKRSISAGTAERSDGQTVFLVRYTEGGSYSPCEDRHREHVSPRRGPIPTLYPPPRTSVIHGTIGGSLHYSEASGRLRTELRPAQLVAHYGVQLRAEGWEPQSESSGSDIAGQTWRVKDRRGKAWLGILVAAAIPGSDDRDIVLRVVPLDP